MTRPASSPSPRLGPRRIRGWLVAAGRRRRGRFWAPTWATLPTHGDVKIKFIGVYDTVGALGVPIPAAARVNEPIVGFHDTTLGDIVENAPCKCLPWTRNAGLTFRRPSPSV